MKSYHSLTPGSIAYVVIVLLACVALLLAPDMFKTPYTDNTQRPLARILSADNSRVIQSGFIKTGTQNLRALVLDGPFKGQEIDAWNLLQGSFEMDKIFSPGDEVILALNTDEDNNIANAQASDFYRGSIELILFAVFALMLILYAGWTGVKALVSFVFAILLIWRILIPSFLLGWDPILVSLAMLTLVAIVTMTLIVGMSDTALVAILGTFAGIALTCILAVFLFPKFQLSGAVLQWSETILHSGFSELNLDHLFIAAVFIGASGAVMDLAIDVSAAMREVIGTNPKISMKDLIISGITVGRAMTGTLVTTLLMAYISGELGLIMAFMGRGIQPINIVNTNHLAAEIMRTIVGCLGLVTVAPFTAILGGVIFTRSFSTQKATHVSLSIPEQENA